MEPTFNNSFIPKKSLAAAPSTRKRGATNFLLIIAVLVFFLSILGAAGAFLYGEYLEIDIERKKEQLDRARGAFEPSLINELTRLDARIASAQTILDSHIAPTRFFGFMEENTLENVRFNSMTVTPSVGSTMNITLGGEATSFSSVALQSDVFKKSSLLVEPIIFSGFQVNNFGRVTFNVTATIDARELLFHRTLRSSRGVDPESVNESF